jgi:hypothetical protein
MSGGTTVKFTKEEEAQVVTGLKAVAVALADYWDVLRELEMEHASEIEHGLELFSSLAGDCGTPAHFDDIDDEDVLQAFYEAIA